MDKPVLIGTSNPHKLSMLQRILRRAHLPWTTLADVFGKQVPDVQETGSTFIENAQIKARELSKQYHGYVVATDGGMAIPGLGDAWNGLYTRRFAGEGATDDDRVYKILDLAKDLPDDRRKMQWQEAYAIARDGKIVDSATCDGPWGTLTREYDPHKYKPGIWLCSLWYVDSFGKHFFDLTPEEREQHATSWNEIEACVSRYFASLS
ncbi:MAG TPA: non-canonical purine NTP pyrophosphatase [Bacillota bacterium]|nr:non-canonical purine NTP pyrophosphatase [Bacillota bacterium]